MNFDNIAQLTQPTEQDISREVLIEKYAKGDETTVEQVRQRVPTANAKTCVPNFLKIFTKP